MKFITFLVLILLFSCQLEQSETNSSESDVEIREKQPIIKAPISAIDSLTLDTTSRIYTDLSNQFNFQSRIQTYALEYDDSTVVDFYIFDKKTGETVQEIGIQSYFLYYSRIYRSDNVLSYITGKNKDLQIVDNDYGDIIIADFNFDGLEDLALISDQGGNGGPMYNYYLQSNSRQFKLDAFLTDSMSFFPETFNKNRKSLTTVVHASAVSECSTTFTYNQKLHSWKKTHREIIEF